MTPGRRHTVMASSRAEAEELVPDAFVQLVTHWDRVSRYDQPEAWVRPDDPGEQGR